MCFVPGADPFTIGTIISAIGTGASVVGQVQAGKAEAAAATYRSKQERILAEDALRRGSQAEEAQRRKAAALASRQKAVMAAGNVDLGSGSPLAIIGDTALLGEYDAQIIKGNAQREAQYHTTNAGLSDMEASGAKSAGAMGAFSTLLSGAGSLADKWYKPVGVR